MLQKLGDNLDRIFVILYTFIIPAILQTGEVCPTFAFDAFELVEVLARGIGAGSREPTKEKRIGLR